MSYGSPCLTDDCPNTAVSDGVPYCTNCIISGKCEGTTSMQLTLQRELFMPVIQALFMYWYNTEPDEIMQAVYDNPVGAYLEEKTKMYNLGLHIFWGQIDYKHQCKLVDAACDKYMEEAERRMVCDSGSL